MKNATLKLMMHTPILLGTVVSALALTPLAASAAPASSVSVQSETVVSYHTVALDGVKIFYREAGPKNAPTVLLLHGFPTSSHMFRNLIPKLADRDHVIAPDYPGYGQSDQPAMDQFSYSFVHFGAVVDNLSTQLGFRK